MQDLKVRVFKWNEKLNNVEESEGLFLLRVNKKDMVLSIFVLTDLSTLGTIEYWLVYEPIEEKEYFSKHTMSLRKTVSSHLLSCFQFDIQKQPHKKKPTILIIVNVYTSRKANGAPKRVFSSAFLEGTRY